MKFKPEILNRIDEIVRFNPLNNELLEKIAFKFINQLKDRLNIKSKALYMRLSLEFDIEMLLVQQFQMLKLKNLKRLIMRGYHLLLF